jgi:FAD/FMN-containing dehydrogenase
MTATTTAPSPNDAVERAGVGPEAIGDLRTSLIGPVIIPGDPDYDAARAVWNGVIDRRPGAIACCRGTADVVEAVRVAHDHGLVVAVRGGGR